MATPAGFSGFSKETIGFLRDIGANNNKRWFEKNRADYEQHLLQPLRELVTSLSEFMTDVDPELVTTPAVNKTISRIHRDTRFSKDKSPYRDRAWIVFKRPGKDWATHACGYFFEITPETYRYGMGFCNAAPKIMATFRQMIDDDLDVFESLIAPFRRQRTFVLEGEQYKRTIDPTKPDAVQSWYQRKNICLLCNRKHDKVLFSGKLVNRLIDGFAFLTPCHEFFQKAAARVRQA